MPPRYVDPDYKKTYILREDEEAMKAATQAGEEPPKVAKFLFCAPSLSGQARLQDKLTTLARDKQRKGDDGDEIFLSQELCISVLKATLVGWEDWILPDGREIKPEYENGSISDRSLSMIEFSQRTELAAKGVQMLQIPTADQD